MKLPLCTLLISLGFSSLPAAEVIKVKPVTNNPATARAVTTVVPRPQIVSVATTFARSDSISSAAIRTEARRLLADNHQPAANADIDALMQQILAEANAQNSADLESMMTEMQKNAAKKKALRENQQSAKNARDSLSELSAQDQLKLQQAQERHRKLEKLLSDLLKKSSDTSDSLTKNQK